MHPIRLRGARTHNLKGIDLDLRPSELVVITGVSGAGKSSLALDTLYSEGQRRFVESFSPYARQFLERLERPPIDELDPIAAAVAVDRRAPVKSSRSTVATMADLEPYFSALFTREAVPVCPDCGVEAIHTDPTVLADRTAAAHEGATAMITYRVPAGSAERFLEVRETLLKAGYRRLLLDDGVRDLDEVKPSEALASGGNLDVVVDRVKIATKDKRRLGEAIEAAWRGGNGEAAIVVQSDKGNERVRVARGLACPKCARLFDAPKPGLFSYQSPLGACPSCRGFGRTIGIDWSKVVPDETRSVKSGAIRPWLGKSSTHERGLLKKWCIKNGIAIDKPWRDLGEKERALVLDGEGTWSGGRYPGVRAWFKWLEGRTYKMHVRVLLARYRAYDECVACEGKRLSKEALCHRVGGIDLAAWHGLELRDACGRLRALKTTTGQGEMARKELVTRLGYLEKVGLGYLTLDRQARTLSGGEAQRVSLTSALGTSLTGALFVLDEPTVGLHPSDIPPLLDAMRSLADAGNAVVVIEHEPLVIRAADRIVELGPGAGERGGSLVYDGPVEGVIGNQALATYRALVPTIVPSTLTRPKASGAINVVGAKANNLRDVSVSVPLGVVVAITGASGSGKSTLVDDILYRAIARARGYRDVELPGSYTRLEGTASVKTVTLVDQAPLGRTSRGNAATYTNAWNRIRTLFADLPEAKERGLAAGHFSFNVAAGRCEACSGEGSETVEMQFLADVSLTCPSCRGRRFKDDVLEVKLRGKSAFDVLSMSIDETLKFFEREAAIIRALGPLTRLGLGYVALGQPLSTLSGGEAQRLKLARALAEAREGALFILDEPSAGLHAEEIAHVNEALANLVRAGASVVVVDHDLDVIAASDWVIDLGPGAGGDGGKIVAEGTPDDIARGEGRTAIALRQWKESRSAKPKKAASVKAIERDEVIAPASIHVVNAREHNLKDVTCHIPHGKIVVVTGPSGSGKSTLAFDVVFAEGQRRFLETLTPYARQFLPMMPRPDVDRVTGVPPSIALEQRTTRSGANSTVATVTEIAHYLRLLFAKVGVAHCPSCDVPIAARSVDALYRAIAAAKGKRVLLAPAVTARKGTYLDVFTNASRAGIERAICDGAVVSTDAPPKLKKTAEHSIDLVVHEGDPKTIDRATFDRALALGRGAVKTITSAAFAAGRFEEAELMSTTRSCPRCSMSVPELDPRWFSFNTKQGRCEACEGSGIQGGPEAAESDDASSRQPCRVCDGSRLSPLPRAVRLGGARYHEINALAVGSARDWSKKLSFEGDAKTIAEAPLRELVHRLAFVLEVGLGYLNLDRRAASLSGGEMQRLRLAAQLGSGLTGALYVLDEPTIGLHPRDTGLLLENLRRLADMGSTVLLVEHDTDTIRAADHLIDIGPSGGRGGGRIVAEGPPSKVLADPASPTGRALADERRIGTHREVRPAADAFLELTGARAHNLKVDKLRIPFGRMTVVAGVSGSGKSTLVRQVLYPAVRRALSLEAPTPGAFDKLKLPKSLMRALAVDRSPIGRTPRSVPATFLGIWDEVRKVFAKATLSGVRGYGPSRFSFNSAAAGGRCTACEGQGVIAHEMSFLPDVTTACEACAGLRFEPATLDVKYLGYSIGEVLNMTAQEAVEVFAAHKKIAGPLRLMCDLGVGYLKIGQGSHTLSGGEAQRLKLAAELTATIKSKPTLYVLDEPTTGLHLADVERLVGVLDKLVARGDTLVVIEHHPSVIACADHVIELGPEGGAGGGLLVAEGTPREIAQAPTATGRVLKALFSGDRAAKKPRREALPALDSP